MHVSWKRTVKVMIGHLGFSYVGFIFLLCLLIPNLIWASKQTAYDHEHYNEHKVFFDF